MTKGRLFIVSGPSGVGKDTVVGEVLKRLPDAFLSVSYTTREPRGREKEGVDYFYITREQFEQEVAAGNMLEYCDYVSAMYGTPRPPVEQALSEGKPVFLVIERVGMEKVKQVYPDAVTVFLAPPSMDALTERLTGRKSDSPEKIRKRLAEAENELSHQDEYKHVVVNDDLDRTVEEILHIVKQSMK